MPPDISHCPLYFLLICQYHILNQTILKQLILVSCIFCLLGNEEKMTLIQVPCYKLCLRQWRDLY